MSDKRYLVRKKFTSESFIIGHKDALELATALKEKRHAVLQAYKGSIAHTEIADFKLIEKKTCADCGDEYDSHTEHYCTADNIEQSLEDYENTQGLANLREQMSLMKKGVPAKEAYQRAFGEEWKPVNNRAQLEDAKNGKGFFDKDGNFTRIYNG